MENTGFVTGKIIEIESKKSRLDGKTFFDINFRMIETGNFYTCYVYTVLRNYANWRHLLQPGNILGNLKFKKQYGKTLIDGDSKPVLVEQRNEDVKPIKKQVPKASENIQQSLFNDEDLIQ